MNDTQTIPVRELTSEEVKNAAALAKGHNPFVPEKRYSYLIGYTDALASTPSQDEIRAKDESIKKLRQALQDVYDSVNHPHAVTLAKAALEATKPIL